VKYSTWKSWELTFLPWKGSVLDKLPWKRVSLKLHGELAALLKTLYKDLGLSTFNRGELGSFR
jgi:hypothetical protein